VRFTDSASNENVNLSGNLEPQFVEVNSDTLDYVFSSNGTITGNASLSKNGASTLSLSGTATHTYNGGTDISEGTLALTSSNIGLGTGLIELSGGTLALPSSATFLGNSILVTANSSIDSPYNGNSTVVDSYGQELRSEGFPTLDLSQVEGILSIKGAMDDFGGTIAFGSGSGMLRLNSGTDPQQDINFGSAVAHFDLGTAEATLTNRNGEQDIALGALSGGPSTHLNGRQSGSGNTATTYRIGALNTDTFFDGTIDQGGDQSGLNIVKEGDGSLYLGGTSSFTGTVRVEAGTLALPGSLDITGSCEILPGATLDLNGGTLATDSLSVAPGATLIGPGTIKGEFVNDGTLISSSGTLLLEGPVVNNGTARLTGSALLATTDEFVNDGVLDLLTASGEIPDNFENNGIVIDSSDLKLTAFEFSNGIIDLSVQTHPEHNYQLQSSPNLTDPSWTNVDSAKAGDGTVKTFTDTPGETSRFYRVEVTP
jgi:autotransporter-associated beta strand protein